MVKEYQEMINALPYKSLNEIEKALSDRYNADFDELKSSNYNKVMYDIKRSISRIFLALSEGASCDEVLKALDGKAYRLEAFERYLNNNNYMSVFMQL